MVGQKQGSASQAWLLAATLVCAAYALAVAATGGFDARVAGVRIRSQSWARPALLSVLAAVLLGYRSRERLAALSVAAWGRVSSMTGARQLTSVALAWTLVAGLVFGTFAVGGSDSFGYLSQARLLAHGHLTDVIPLRPQFAWPDVEATLTPLAYRHGRSPGVMAPTYPPGLSLLMAPLSGGTRTVFWIVPMFGALAVWLTFRLGVVIGQPLAGGMAALLLSLSPTFLFQLVQPMSDVPVTACWVGVLVLASHASMQAGRGLRPSPKLPPSPRLWRTGRRTAVALAEAGQTSPRPFRAAAAGALASLAILIRPNLAPLVCVPLVALAGRDRPARWRALTIFVAAALPGLVALGWIQNVRYGSPLSSGYGAIQDVFAWGNVGPNLSRYPRWLTETHTWFIWLWVTAPVWIVRLSTGRRLAWTALAFCAGVWMAYLPYASFGLHEWTYTRFLLPAIPIMLLFAAAAACRALDRLPIAWRAPAAAVLLLFLAAALLQSSRTRGAFVLGNGERKYPDAGAFVRDRLPASAFVFAMQHSGSVRYYAERPTLRWDLLDPFRLDEVVLVLRANGFIPFVVIDEWEDAAFRRRFEEAGQRAVRHLSPLAVFGEARVYGFDQD